MNRIKVNRVRVRVRFMVKSTSRVALINSPAPVKSIKVKAFVSSSCCSLKSHAGLEVNIQRWAGAGLSAYLFEIIDGIRGGGAP